MNKTTVAYCWTVSLLDLIPRYGRLYYIGKDPQTGEWTTKNKTVVWKWQKHGHWGFNILDRQHLLWPYLYHKNPDLLDPTTYTKDDEHLQEQRYQEYRGNFEDAPDDNDHDVW